MMLAEDLDLWLRLGEIGTLANLRRLIVRYRLHGNSVSEQAGLYSGNGHRRSAKKPGNAATSSALLRRRFPPGPSPAAVHATNSPSSTAGGLSNSGETADGTFLWPEVGPAFALGQGKPQTVACAAIKKCLTEVVH